jgi:hypothetical protein
VNEEQRRVWDYLNQFAQGHENRRSSSEIRDALSLESGGATNEHVRDLIRDMILNHNCCIGSRMYERGYWIINSQEELSEVVASLRDRANGVLARADALERNWANRRRN